jgi:hypothetical protein
VYFPLSCTTACRWTEPKIHLRRRSLQIWCREEFTHRDQLPTQLPTDEQSFVQSRFPCEYWDIVCKFALFGQFFTVASPKLLAHRFCDLIFTKWVVMKATIQENKQKKPDALANALPSPTVLLPTKQSRPELFVKLSDPAPTSPKCPRSMRYVKVLRKREWCTCYIHNWRTCRKFFFNIYLGTWRLWHA